MHKTVEERSEFLVSAAHIRVCALFFMPFLYIACCNDS